ncbi:hypothetical protein [Filimonas effusa]|uniref:Uncharacterized protein n=1 Tax=Filimonas effusa TaxID=2508721 RepID=A0A4Q1D2Y3_9BACT|nr:hypothetical protein [Filimonas effusa]RXK81425.1 hypothetical protein ESB13_21060 [Filimonas effusa]
MTCEDPNNAYVQVLNGNGQKTGSAIVLKVMSGDKVNIQADSWYWEPASSNSQMGLGWPDLIASLAGGIAGTIVGSHSAALVPVPAAIVLPCYSRTKILRMAWADS